ncbi:MAG: hypothetical protein JW727_06450 [Candidatus Aenigmarchaeota archaeon]|nr:hypothetical protein [Candidatus Aenigmarchaeota archaeon]
MDEKGRYRDTSVYLEMPETLLLGNVEQIRSRKTRGGKTGTQMYRDAGSLEFSASSEPYKEAHDLLYCYADQLSREILTPPNDPQEHFLKGYILTNLGKNPSGSKRRSVLEVLERTPRSTNLEFSLAVCNAFEVSPGVFVELDTPYPNSVRYFAEFHIEASPGEIRVIPARIRDAGRGSGESELEFNKVVLARFLYDFSRAHR